MPLYTASKQQAFTQHVLKSCPVDLYTSNGAGAHKYFDDHMTTFLFIKWLCHLLNKEWSRHLLGNMVSYDDGKFVQFFVL